MKLKPSWASTTPPLSELCGQSAKEKRQKKALQFTRTATQGSIQGLLLNRGGVRKLGKSSGPPAGQNAIHFKQVSVNNKFVQGTLTELNRQKKEILP